MLEQQQKQMLEMQQKQMVEMQQKQMVEIHQKQMLEQQQKQMMIKQQKSKQPIHKVLKTQKPIVMKPISEIDYEYEEESDNTDSGTNQSATNQSATNQSATNQSATNYNVLDYNDKITELQLKELELNNKTAQFQKMVNNYDYLFSTTYIHVEVSNPFNSTSYQFPLHNIENITGIKLNHYSIPNIQLNIEENKNNYLIIKKNDIETKVSINKGKYTIDALISALNDKLSDIKITLTQEQHIKIENINKTNFDLIQTELLKTNLGFTNQTINNTEYTSDNIWDLRINNKIYLYITNLSDTPFGVLFYDGTSTCEFKFKEPINLDTLDIVFKDARGLLYNFYNLPHTLSFLISKLK